MSDVATWVGSGAGVLALVGVGFAGFSYRVQVKAFILQRTQVQDETNARERRQADKERKQAAKIGVRTSSTTREQTVVL